MGVVELFYFGDGVIDQWDCFVIDELFGVGVIGVGECVVGGECVG